MLANRLKNVMSLLVSKARNAFVKGTNEVIHSILKKEKGVLF